MKDRDVLLAAAGIADIHAEECDLYDCMEEAAESRATARRLRELADAQPVAWRDPSNEDDTQAFTLNRERAERWPHIYSQALYAAAPSQERINPCAKIFEHKWLDPKCVENGCQSLAQVPREYRNELLELADEYARRASLPAWHDGKSVNKARDALIAALDAVAAAAPPQAAQDARDAFWQAYRAIAENISECDRETPEWCAYQEARTIVFNAASRAGCDVLAWDAAIDEARRKA